MPGKFRGMRDNLTKEAHGLAWQIMTNGDIIECTWKGGKRHGLCRVIHEDAVIIAVFKEGEVVAIRSFTGKLVENAREDGNGYL